MKIQKSYINPYNGDVGEEEVELPDNFDSMTDDQFAEWFCSRTNICIEVDGHPLTEIGLDGLEIVDAKGKLVGPLLGFTVYQGQTMRESIEASIPLGCTIRISHERLRKMRSI